MMIFKSENELVETLDHHDNLVKCCASGGISFREFESKYNYFYGYYALDGHESDEEELRLFNKYEDRIKFHKAVTEDVLNIVCSDDNAKDPLYIKHGRFGSDVAVKKLIDLVHKYFK